jgi:hypothetical protein
VRGNHAQPPASESRIPGMTPTPFGQVGINEKVGRIAMKRR